MSAKNHLSSRQEIRRVGLGRWESAAGEASAEQAAPAELSSTHSRGSRRDQETGIELPRKGGEKESPKPV